VLLEAAVGDDVIVLHHCLPYLHQTNPPQAKISTATTMQFLHSTATKTGTGTIIQTKLQTLQLHTVLDTTRAWKLSANTTCCSDYENAQKPSTQHKISSLSKHTTQDFFPLQACNTKRTTRIPRMA
jgi:hypothetical protein